MHDTALYQPGKYVKQCRPTELSLCHCQVARPWRCQGSSISNGTTSQLEAEVPITMLVPKVLRWSTMVKNLSHILCETPPCAKLRYNSRMHIEHQTTNSAAPAEPKHSLMSSIAWRYRCSEKSQRALKDWGKFRAAIRGCLRNNLDLALLLRLLKSFFVFTFNFHIRCGVSGTLHRTSQGHAYSGVRSRSS